MGEEAFRGLLPTWNGFREETKVWLIEWGMRRYPLHAAGLIADTLRGEEVPLIRAALRCLRNRDALQPLFRPLLNQLVHHSIPAVRAAAIEAGGVVEYPHAIKILKAEPPEVRLAILQSIATSKDRAYAIDMTTLLRDSDWRIRAAASAALTAMGGSAVDILRPLVDDPDAHVRVAAMNVLLALGEECPLVETIQGGGG